MAIHLAQPAASKASAASSEIGHRWLALLEVGDVEGALSLYGPSATVHTGVVNFVGYQGVRLYLGQVPLISWSPRRVEFHATDHVLVILWRPARPGCRDSQAAMTRMRVSGGKIVEQWVGGATGSSADSPEIPGSSDPTRR
jgi:hypothetical protein